MEQLNLQELIKNIAPLYNSYKQTSRSISGVNALLVMWEVGDLLKKTIEESKIAPHNLYRKIYGKAEGQENITQKSYITRDFLSRSYRVRNIFENKSEIKKYLPNLKRFRLFSQAMPFIDNPKYSFEGKEKNDLFNLLNSDKSYKEIITKVYRLQKEKIGIQNPRDQKLNELEPQKQIFINFYNYLFNLIKNNTYEDLKKEISSFDSSIIIKLSSNTSALSQEGLRFLEIPKILFNLQWSNYIGFLNNFSRQTNAKERRRFRRLISPERIVKLAEMLQAITSETSFKNFKR